VDPLRALHALRAAQALLEEQEAAGPWALHPAHGLRHELALALMLVSARLHRGSSGSGSGSGSGSVLAVRAEAARAAAQCWAAAGLPCHHPQVRDTLTAR
jgi:hypothetical protein